MKKIKIIVLLFSLFSAWVLLGTGCSQTQVKKEEKKQPLLIVEGGINTEIISQVPPEGWSFERKAITFLIRAGEDLNIFQGRSHTLLLGIYQVSDPNGFNAMTSTKEGLQQLLEKEIPPAGSGITALEKRIVRPGAEEIIVLDRAQSSQYVGMVAGYFDLEPERVSRLIKIPAVQEISEKTGLARFNPFAGNPKPPPARPGKLKVLIDLDSYQIKMVDKYAD